MAKNLVIVESPAKAKTIEKFLGKDYKVVASMGHIRDLPVKNIGVDVDSGFEPQYEVTKEKTKVVNELKKLAKTSETVWIATDEDREGEAIGWHLCHILGLKAEDTKRIVFHEITKNAITHSIESPRTIDMNLVDAQQARRVLDRLVGYKVSPVLWKKIRKGLSAGRVQSVAVKLIIEREREIKAFKPEESWKLTTILDFGGQKFISTFTKLNGKGKKLKTKEDTIKLLSTLVSDIKSLKEAENAKGNIEITGEATINFILKEKIKKDSKRRPSPPFTTSTLQQEASRKCGFTIKQTMSVAQKLYEGVDFGNGERQGLITYMRTDSLNLSKQAIAQSLEVIKDRFGDKYATNGKGYKTKSAGAQEAHEAIRPVNLKITPESLKGTLSPQELRLYDLIWKRTLASQMQDAIVEVTTMNFSPEGLEDQIWISKGEVVKFDGFMKVYMEGKDDGDEEEQIEGLLPNMDEGEIAISKGFTSTQSFSRPPARYTEASLVKKLESEGIGRPSTYAPTITTVIDRGYIEKVEKKYLAPTDISFLVNDFLEEYFNQMMDYKFTSKVEEDLDKISVGEEKYAEMLTEFYKWLDNDLTKASETAEKVVEMVGKKCPECGNDLVYKYSSGGKFIGCSNYPECKFTDRLEEEKKQMNDLEARYNDKKCSKCDAQMVVKTGRYGPFLACSNYPNCKTIESIKDPKQEVIERLLEEGGFLVDEESGAELVVKNSKRGLFLAAKEYPKVKIAKPIPKEILKKANEEMKKAG